MQSRLHKVAIVTDDIEGAIRFYTTTFGLQVAERFPNEDDEDFVFLKSGDMILELMPQKTMKTDVGFHHISFQVDSIEAATADLRTHGVELAGAPIDAGVGGIHFAFLQGPNAVPLQIFQRDQT